MTTTSGAGRRTARRRASGTLAGPTLPGGPGQPVQPVHPAQPASPTRTFRAGLAVVGLGVLTAVAGCSSTHGRSAGATSVGSTTSGSAAATSEETYGSLPTFLPSESVAPDAVLTGSLARPAVTSEGDGVRVHLAGSDLTVTVSGPDVPGEGLPNQPETTTCTWTITVTDTGAPATVAIGDFSAIDQKGEVFHPVLAPGSRPPTTVRPGVPVSFQVRAIMPTGEGLMRWSPDSGGTVASWDFVVEND